MKKAGCYLVVFGFETGNEETLTRIKKGTTLDQARLAVKYSKEVGLQTYGFFILGFPWENINHIKDTERLIFELNCDFIEISFAEPFYSTELYDLCVEKKLIDKSILGTDYFCLQANGTEFLTNKQLVKMRDHILIRYYLRPSYIIKKFFGVFRKPIILINYSKYGIRLLKNLLFQAKKLILFQHMFLLIYFSTKRESRPNRITLSFVYLGQKLRLRHLIIMEYILVLMHQYSISILE